jgi:uncharacterized protein YeaO (DUF488 family)
MLKVKRVYEPPAAGDGFRVLVDRVWARGLTKQKARVDLWAKDIAPSTELRKWFGHDPGRWQEFKKRYKQELRSNNALRRLRQELNEHKKATLLYAAKDSEHNNAVALSEILAKAKSAVH